MIKRFYWFLLLFLALTAFSQGFGQTHMDNNGGMILLYQNTGNLTKKANRGYYVGPHKLGEAVTNLLNDFERTYTYFVETGGAYATKQKKIQKPIIYKSIKKVIKHYDKMLNKQNYDLVTINKNLTKTLGIAIKLMNYNTSVVEKELKPMKLPEEIEKYLYKLKFLEENNN